MSLLKDLQKHKPKAGGIAATLNERTRHADQLRSKMSSEPGTQIDEIPSELGSAEKLLSELKQESKKIAKDSIQHVGFDPSDTRHISDKLKQRSIKMIHGGGASQKIRSTIADNSTPFWLIDPPRSSPLVDQLVPKAREALNDFLTEEMPAKELPIAIRKAVNSAAGSLATELRISTRDIEEAIDDLHSLMTGKGPLQSLYDDPCVTDIHLDGHSSIKCIRRGQALETPFKFRSTDEYEAYVNGMLQSIDRVLNLSSPIIDAVLNDPWRSRINCVHSSLLDGKESSVVVRVPRLQQITFGDLIQTKTLPPQIAAWLSELVSIGEANILVIGPTGSGKTVMTTALLSAVGSQERICTIEDVPEIFVPTAHLEKLVSRPENAQGSGSVGMEQLLRAALRRAPHRIVVGEIRDKEGPLFLKALETGHAGSVATIHSSNPVDGLWRLLDVVAAYEKAPQESLQRRISRSVNILVSMQKIDGAPCMMEIAEVHNPINGEFVVQPIVKYHSTHQGKRHWQICTNHSIWIDLLLQRGVKLQTSEHLFAVPDSEKVNREQPNE